MVRTSRNDDETTVSEHRCCLCFFSQPRPARRASQILMFTTFFSVKCGRPMRFARREEVSAAKYLAYRNRRWYWLIAKKGEWAAE